MKKLVAYLLIFLVSFVYTYESIHILANVLGNDSSYSWIECMESSEKSAESEGSKEQKEKVDFLEHLYLISQLSLAQIGTNKLDPSHAINFSSSDHSQTIYSPPEELA